MEQRKIVDYLLNLNHAQSGSKARFFIARGFAVSQWQQLHDALVAQGQNNTVTKVIATPYGIRNQVDCYCPTPDGTNPCIRSVWEIRPDDRCPRLLTAHPMRST